MINKRTLNERIGINKGIECKRETKSTRVAPILSKNIDKSFEIIFKKNTTIPVNIEVNFKFLCLHPL